MRRPNRPYREPNEYDYQNYIWKDLAERIMKEQSLEKETTVDDLATRLETEFDEQVSTESFEAAEKWPTGFDKLMPELDGVDMGDEGKATLVFSILGANLLQVLCEALEVNTERITIEQRRSATGYLREYSKILIWIGANVDQLKKGVPSVE